MRYKGVGNSGLKVSVLSLGSNNFGRQVSEEETIRLIDKAIDLGINSIDTADVYTGGRSEEIIGKAIQGRRDDVVIASKVGLEGGASGRNIVAKVNQSLERLRTDHIDLYYIHAFDNATPLEETMSTLDGLVRQGKLHRIACSNFTGPQMDMARLVCESRGYAQFIADQPEYNLLQRRAETDVIPYCVGHLMGVFPYSPLMGGFLTGKYTRDRPAPEGSRGAYNERFLASADGATYDRIDRLRTISAEAGLSLMELSIGWLLMNNAVTSVIVGASKASQLPQTAAIADLSIGADVVRKADQLTAS